MQTVWFSVEEIRAKLNSILRYVTELDSIIGVGGEIEGDFSRSPHREKIEMAAQAFNMLKKKSTLKNQTFLEECAPLLNNLKPALAFIAGELQQSQGEIDAIINILRNAQGMAAAHALFKKKQTKDSVIQLVENDNFDYGTIEYLSIARKWGADIRADWDMLRQFPTQRAILLIKKNNIDCRQGWEHFKLLMPMIEAADKQGVNLKGLWAFTKEHTSVGSGILRCYDALKQMSYDADKAKFKSSCSKFFYSLLKDTLNESSTIYASSGPGHEFKPHHQCFESLINLMNKVTDPGALSADKLAELETFADTVKQQSAILQKAREPFSRLLLRTLYVISGHTIGNKKFKTERRGERIVRLAKKMAKKDARRENDSDNSGSGFSSGNESCMSSPSRPQFKSTTVFSRDDSRQNDGEEVIMEITWL